MLKPIIKVILSPELYLYSSPLVSPVNCLPGMNAIFTGKFKLPDLKLYPTANTIPIPDNDRFGPTPTS